MTSLFYGTVSNSILQASGDTGNVTFPVTVDDHMPQMSCLIEGTLVWPSVYEYRSAYPCSQRKHYYVSPVSCCSQTCLSQHGCYGIIQYISRNSQKFAPVKIFQPLQSARHISNGRVTGIGQPGSRNSYGRFMIIKPLHYFPDYPFQGI